MIIQPHHDEANCKELVENHEERPRVYRNTLIFLCPLDSERLTFEKYIKRKCAWHYVDTDTKLSLTFEQKKEVKDSLKKAETDIKEHLRNLYRIVLLPTKEGFKEIDLGIPPYGTDATIDKEVYNSLRNEGEILPKFAPLTLREKYLRDQEFAETKNILESFYKTPGEIRIVSDDVLKTCIKEGIAQGLFGIGDKEDGRPRCRYFKADVSPELIEGEVLIKADLCEPEEKEYKPPVEVVTTKPVTKIEGTPTTTEYGKKYRTIRLKLGVPTGKLSDIVRLIPFIKTKFTTVDVKVEILAENGEMSELDYEDKIKEAIKQAEVDIEDEWVG